MGNWADLGSRRQPACRHDNSDSHDISLGIGSICSRLVNGSALNTGCLSGYGGFGMPLAVVCKLNSRRFAVLFPDHGWFSGDFVCVDIQNNGGI